MEPAILEELDVVLPREQRLELLIGFRMRSHDDEIALECSDDVFVPDQEGLPGAVEVGIEVPEASRVGAHQYDGMKLTVWLHAQVAVR